VGGHTELVSDQIEVLDGADWCGIHDAYGPATAIPELLQAAAARC
jgi:hypothetical protein